MSNQSVLGTIPLNKSLAQSTKFTFVIPTMPFLNYFVQTANIPTVSTSAAPQANPHALIKRHGDTLVYDMLVLTFLVDEDLQIWEESYNWLKALTKPQEFAQYKKFYNKENKLYHDGILTINTNSNIPNLRYTFRNMHPTSLGQVSYSTMENSQVVMSCDMTLEYDFFDLDRI